MSCLLRPDVCTVGMFGNKKSTRLVCITVVYCTVKDLLCTLWFLFSAATPYLDVGLFSIYYHTNGKSADVYNAIAKLGVCQGWWYLCVLLQKGIRHTLQYLYKMAYDTLCNIYTERHTPQFAISVQSAITLVSLHLWGMHFSNEAATLFVSHTHTHQKMEIDEV